MRRAPAAFFTALLLTAASAVAAGADDVGAGPVPIDAFTRLERGMGEQQVLAAVGFPTSEGLYRPRLDRMLSVVGLGATYRTYFYRGMGRVLLTGGSKLVQNGTVSKVEVDPGEPGTPR